MPAWLAFAQPAPAQGDPLRQQGIEVEAQAADAVRARDAAHAQARRIAFQRMAQQLGIAPPPLSDAQLENLVASLVIEQERVTQQRYLGRLTVIFDGPALRALLGPAVPAGAGMAAAATALAGRPATTFIEAAAGFAGLPEWLTLRRRLLQAAPVASLEIRAIAPDGAMLRLGLRLSPAEAAEALAASGILLQPPADPRQPWRVGLASG
ncbi:MAG: hypothetical protein RMK64_05480 [Rhodovarius sp.]|nr:hypothetical protein [Rhodovarius sp.]MDW8314404.1 hypothetical protein [Rhodovarius sp.]